MAAAQKDFVKDIKTASELEQQLLISYAQKGVCVLDVYSAEWGPCKAITETFRRLNMDAGDAVHLRFFTVECNAVLESLKNPQEHQAAGRQHQRPKNTEAIKDALPEGWEPVLTAQRGKSRPLFVTYKEGKKMSAVEGVDTPAIRSIIKDLCTVKTPASEFITNPRAQELWDDQFNPEESEVGFEKFCKGLQVHCGYTVAFNEDEKKALLEALGIGAKEAKDRIVTADALQKWVGDDEGTTVAQLTKALLPGYEERAAAVAAEREAEEKRRREQEEQERKEREEREAEEQRQKEEQERNERASKLQALKAAIAANLALVQLDDSAEATEEAVAASSDKIDNAAKAASSSERTAGSGAAPEVAPNADEAARELPAEPPVGAWGAIKAAVPAADFLATAAARVACCSSSSVTEALSEEADDEGAAAFAAKILTADAAALQALVGAESLPEGFDGFRAKWATVPKEQPGLLGALLKGGCERPEGSLFVKAPTGTVILSPLTPLFTEAADGLVPVTGVPDVIPFAKLSAHDNDAFVALPWFARFTVGDAAEFGEYLGRAEFEEAINGSAAYADDSKRLLAPARARAAAAARDEMEPPAEKKPATPPADDAKPAEEEQQPAKADTPADEKEEQPAKADTPADEKPAEEAPAAADDKPAEEQPAKTDSPAPAEEAAEKKEEEAPPKADTPADEKPAADDSAAAAEEKPAEDAAPAAEEQPAKADTPADEKPATPPAEDAKPAEEEQPPKADTPADEKPAEEQPAKADTPAEEEPAKPDTPADEKPADAGAAEEKPAAEGDAEKKEDEEHPGF